MHEDNMNDAMLELYLFESTTLLESLDEILLTAESARRLTAENINEIFRIMHTIKGSSAMMAFTLISQVSHQTEDLFSIIRDIGVRAEFFDPLFDQVLRVSDFLKAEVEKIREDQPLAEENPELEAELHALIGSFRQSAPKKPRSDPGRMLGGMPVRRDPPPAQASDGPAPDRDGTGHLSAGIPLARAEDRPSSAAWAGTDVPASGVPAVQGADDLSSEAKRGTGIPAAGTPVGNEEFVQPEAFFVPPEDNTPQTFNLHVFFNEGARMENIRAFMLMNKLSEVGTINRMIPSQLENNPETADEIVENGFYLSITTGIFREQIEKLARGTLSVESVSFVRKLPGEQEQPPEAPGKPPEDAGREKRETADGGQRTVAGTDRQTGDRIAPTNSEIAAGTARQQPVRSAWKDSGSGQETGPSAAGSGDSNTVIKTVSGPNPEMRSGIVPGIAPLQNDEDAYGKADVSRQDDDGKEIGESERSGAHEAMGYQKPPDGASDAPLHGKHKASYISVDLTKLDSLLDLVGEIVINESMVRENPDLIGMDLENFRKAARQLNKLTDELQDSVMSVRMVPVDSVFQRMRRIVRDMSKQLGKEAELVLIGENTEADKTILDALTDPLIHLVRNAMDHGIETRRERLDRGKGPVGHIVLSARNIGSDIIISVSDDGRGLDGSCILKKAKERKLLRKAESEYTEKEIFSMLMMPGFSTKDEVTPFSGRGVGLDVVRANIERIGGVVIIESVPDVGTNVFLKIPLTLAIIECMEVRLGADVYSIPISNIREAFKLSGEQLIRDPSGNEIIMLRGMACPVIRLFERFHVPDAVQDPREGIFILAEAGERTGCLMADELIGKFQVVVKPLPAYLHCFRAQNAGISGCTILGDSSISLIVDMQELLS